VELVTVGTGTVAPSGSRTSACHWVGRGNLKILLDCGAGALHRLAQFGLPWHQITHVVLSHFHPDHWGELPMLVYALKYTAVPARREPFVILGPPGVVRLLKKLADGYGPWLLDPGFPIGILDVQAGEPFPLDKDVNLETFPVPHTQESVALSLTAPEGRLVYTGDTGPSSQLARWAAGADLLLAECSLPAQLAMDIHLTPEQAGDLAREAGARRLVLTHFYPPVEFGPGAHGRDALRRTGDGRGRRRPVHHRSGRGESVAVLIVMRHGATEAEVRRVIAVIEEMGYKARPLPGAQRTAVGLVGNDGRVDASRLEGLPGVQDVIHVSKPYKQVSREWKSENTVVRLGANGSVSVGGPEVVTIAGPCSVESERQIIEAARVVKEAGAVRSEEHTSELQSPL